MKSSWWLSKKLSIKNWRIGKWKFSIVCKPFHPQSWFFERGISTKYILGSQKIIKTIFSHVRYLFLFIYLFIFFPNIKIIYSAWYWPKSVLFGQSTQFGGGLNIYLYEWGSFWVKIHSCPNLEEGMLRDQKRKLCPFLNQSIINQIKKSIS